MKVKPLRALVVSVVSLILPFQEFKRFIFAQCVHISSAGFLVFTVLMGVIEPLSGFMTRFLCRDRRDVAAEMEVGS